ncbi:unnamed protein product [Brassica rapa]|uniref:Uncharacterized protein n=2 Tax=Brassica TaxID=3705 RepID=A0A8D9CTN9_BRACM|nr:unnamed protein product [Brassica rapa]
MSDPKLLPNAQKERKLINSGDNNLFLSAPFQVKIPLAASSPSRRHSCGIKFLISFFVSMLKSLWSSCLKDWHYVSATDC